jgi:phage tail-like protein
MIGAMSYRFATMHQKQRCLRTGLAETLLLEPASGDAAPGFAGGVDRLAAAADGELFAIDASGRLSAGDGGGPWVGHARRLVVGRDRLSALTDEAIHQFDRRSLQPLASLARRGTIDIAAAADGDLWCLGDGRIQRFGADGRRRGGSIEVGPAQMIAAVGGTVFLLFADSERLELFDVQQRRAVAIDLSRLLIEAGAGVGPPPARFGESELLQSGELVLVRRRVQDGWPAYLVLDGSGSVVARGRFDQSVQVERIALAGEDIIVAFADNSVRRFIGAASGSGERMLTPAMETGSASEDWVQAKVAARLPEGATLSLRWAAISDQALRQSVDALHTDSSQSVGSRLNAITELLRDAWSPEFIYTAQAGDEGPSAQPFAFPLNQAAGPFLWLYVKLRRNDAPRAPAIDSLTVYHDCRTLLDYLPAIYRGPGDADGTLRQLVGVLEATTHGLDQQIGALADRLDPNRTEAGQLPALAALLGLPFDESLPAAMQRRVIAAAGPLLRDRGTRAGIDALFAALFPGRRVRIVDRTEELNPVALGGAGFRGQRLPSLLAGPSTRSPRLDRRLVLGRTALEGSEDDARIAPAPEVVIFVPASGGERRRLSNAAQRMAEAMIPAGVKVTVRWSPWQPGTPSFPADGLALVQNPAPLELGDGRLGRARLAGRPGRMDLTTLGPRGHRLH